MAKATNGAMAMTGKAARNSTSGRFIERGTKIGGFTAAGSTVDGIVIVEPKFRPKNFTKGQIRKAVRDVKERQRNGELLEAAG